jgi:hypothetical protein
LKEQNVQYSDQLIDLRYTSEEGWGVYAKKDIPVPLLLLYSTGTQISHGDAAPHAASVYLRCAGVKGIDKLIDCFFR